MAANEVYEVYERCQICCVYTGKREDECRYCDKCQAGIQLVPIPMTEFYEKGSHLIKLEARRSRFWGGRPYMGFG